ncbi:hypothetical protein EDC01DRAFT_668917 [Geopyxis carbonaria]|nr:hypothetical protein EDC01DRAFT_668917 [Geopyxis carbonaria]
MDPIPPSPSTITLLLKHSTSTTFLSVLPTTTLTHLKSELLRYLGENAAHIDPFPQDPADVVLGAPKDPMELEKGFLVVDEPAGKEITVKDIGVRDWGVLAWKERGGGGFEVEIPVEEEEEDEEEEGDERQ